MDNPLRYFTLEITNLTTTAIVSFIQISVINTFSDAK